MDADMATADRLWGLFPVNFLHNLVHLAFGIWGLIASRSSAASRSYTVLAGAIYIILAVLGLFFPNGFGLVPLGGNDVWLHAFLGVALLVAGLTLAARTLETVEPAGTRTVEPPDAAPPPDAPPGSPDGPNRDTDPTL
jgi:hypothetical protein